MRTAPHKFVRRPAHPRGVVSQRLVGSPSRGLAMNLVRPATLYPSRLGPRLYPVLFFSAYLLGSVLVFAFGPCQFEIQNATTLYPFLFASQLAIVVGFLLGASYRGRDFESRLSATAIVRAVIVVSVLSLPITLSSRNFGQLSLAEALLDPGTAYAARMHEVTSRDNVSLASIIRASLGPFVGLCVPCGIVYWRQLTSIWRLAWAAGVCALVTESLFVGAAKGLFDVVLIVPWFLWLLLYRTRGQRGRAVFNATPSALRGPQAGWGRKVFLGCLTLAVLLGGFKYFAHSRQSRYGMTGDEYPPWTTDWSEPLYGVKLPASTEYLIHMVSRYWAHGYVGLSECLDLPFEWGYGVGHSTFLMRYAGQFISEPEYFFNRSYPMRLEKVTGYSATNHWHTIYPWLASDVTFPGAIVLIGVLAFVLSRSWQDCLVGGNPFAFGVLSQMLLMFYYVPANNARLMFSEEIITFWGLIIFWQLTRKVR